MVGLDPMALAGQVPMILFGKVDPRYRVMWLLSGGAAYGAYPRRTGGI